MTVVATDTGETRALRAALAEKAADAGCSPHWRAAVATVPRHMFVPRYYCQEPDGWREFTAADTRYPADVYDIDRALTTRLLGGVPTSSSSQPRLMLDMLEALDVADGHRVLEVATGTGYKAALLAERLGSGNVITMEVEPELADRARDRLASCGYVPLVVAADGRAGYPEGAPYDRLIATCGFDDVPCAWVEQVRPGGVIVCPVGSGNVRLVVGEDGTAEGVFLPGGSCFMKARDAGTNGEVTYPGTPDASETTTRAAFLAPDVPDDSEFAFLYSLALPDTAYGVERDATGSVTERRMWGRDGSWACVDRGRVVQAGPRSLWDGVEAAYAFHREHGRPRRDRYGLTVTRERQWAWLDRPAWPVPVAAGARRGPRSRDSSAR
ncbi:protein-L-isoaspartate(D-aspartate) O-methyltransferase [Embleya sp. NBC_00888]|uniref:protein-L-isoaspartate(D-aspartate) O-methyltransferase n=1 Tax=Embleya sp. NBC_00888 TaxID=2975960 RepID=UPI003865D162|nr:protein-L-isoaspartate(D-aspartate) O-methyltransferase [Embleya sp. NBC_00888]